MTCVRDFAYKHLRPSMSHGKAKAILRTSDDFLLCNACGTQYPVTISDNKEECRICDGKDAAPLYLFWQDANYPTRPETVCHANRHGRLRRHLMLTVMSL